ncbi:MAG: hypothetical protein R3A13_05230 [Bdellovibrionota bacterium]
MLVSAGDQAKSVVFGSFFDWKRSSTEGVAMHISSSLIFLTHFSFFLH